MIQEYWPYRLTLPHPRGGKCRGTPQIRDFSLLMAKKSDFFSDTTPVLHRCQIAHAISFVVRYGNLPYRLTLPHPRGGKCAGKIPNLTFFTLTGHSTKTFSRTVRILDLKQLANWISFPMVQEYWPYHLTLPYPGGGKCPGTPQFRKIFHFKWPKSQIFSVTPPQFYITVRKPMQ